MNLLPFVISVILIVSLITATLMRSQQQIVQESKTVRGRLQAEWDLRSLASRKTFDACEAESKFPPKKESSAPLKEKTLSGRLWKCTSKQAKLNISKFIDGSADYLYEPAAALLRALYEGKPFWEPRAEYAILDALRANKDQPLWQLKPQKIFYQIVQGTNTYDEKKGVAPLLDYFILDDKASHPLFFKKASIPVLRALFGKPAADAICSEEKRLNCRLTEKELRSLLERVKTSFDLNNLSNTASFSSNKPDLQAVVTHDGTETTARR